MNITQINLEGGKPTSVQAELSLDELMYLGKLTGSRNGLEANETLTGGDEFNSEIYGCIVGEVFNRFWDSGIDGAIRGDVE